jgi:Tfp pilus assembly protein PilF
VGAAPVQPDLETEIEAMKENEAAAASPEPEDSLVTQPDVLSPPLAEASLPSQAQAASSGLELRMEQAWELEKAGQVDRAMALFRTILVRHPDNLAATYALGTLYEKVGDHLAALELYEKAKRLDPENMEVLLNHANALVVLGRFDLAEKELRRAAKFEPNRPEIYTMLGIVQYRRGLYAQADHELRRAIELDQDSPVAYHYRGESLNQLGKIDEALTMLERAAALEPSNPRTYYVMGILLDRKHRPQEAGAMFRKARSLTPT